MRIISGTNKGMKLYAPEGDSVRPTSDKIKEAIFNMIGNIENDSVALDLFAGAGGIGIEFLARGARRVYFADISHKSLSWVKKNLQLCKFGDRAEIIMSDYEKAIAKLSNEKIKFDFIFADPPYSKISSKDILLNVLKYDLLKPDGMLIIENDESEKVIDIMHENVIKYKEKIYGRTMVRIFKYLEEH